MRSAPEPPLFLTSPPRFLFFTGKGGVGKTSLACASAVRLTDQGARVLLVSTDPASNLAQVLRTAIGHQITPIATVPGLDALEIDPEAAAEAYRERIVAPVRGLLPEREISSIVEQLSGSCTTEVASFNEFTDLLADGDRTAGYDHVVFDTAPTGHTIRLLQLPGSWTDFLEAGKGDASCLGPLAGLDKQRAVYAAAVQALKDATRTRLVLVTRAQPSALAEVGRTYAELAAIGIHAASLVVNAVLPDDAVVEELGAALRRREEAALAGMPAAVAALPRDVVRLKAATMIGVDALRTLLRQAPATAGAHGAHAPDSPADVPGGALPTSTLTDLVDEIEAGGHGVVLCMGKGGVGKTTVAAAVAVALALRGHPVHLTTTDPAAHLDQALTEPVPNLRISRIDPAQATAEYRDRVMRTKGTNLDDAGRAVLAEDLLSPCTEEVAVFQQFSRILFAAHREFVVIDTAPTGHTLLLLDAAGSYHRDVVRQMGEAARYRTPLMVLQDQTRTKVVIVTLPEPTPVTEAQALQDDLARAGITPWAWVVNASLVAARPTGEFLRRRAAAEIEQLQRVTGLAPRVAVIPLLADEPVGEQRLARMTSEITRA